MMCRITSLSRIGRRLRDFLRGRRAVSALEFALIAPVLLLLLMGGFEMFRLYLFTTKVDRAVVSIGDVTARLPEITESDLVDIFELAGELGSPFELSAGDYRIYLVSISNVDDDLTVNWVRDHGSLAEDGQLVDNLETLVDPNLVSDEFDSLIASEAVFRYEPVFPGFLFDERRIYRNAFFRPRLGRLTTVNP